jgi:fermentation-respiration switch protein FrsA (DUF1100 family)
VTAVGFVGLVVAGYLAVVGGMYTFQRGLLYVPSTATPSPAESGVPDIAPVTLETADGLRLMSWYKPADDGRPTLVYFHGNGGHIGYRGDKARPYLDAGYGMLLVSYRGYGGNPGSPTEDGLYADGRAAMAFLAARGVTPGDTVLYGESLGTGVAVHIALEQARASEPLAAVVLEAPFTSAVDAGAQHYPWAPVRWLMKDRFESRSKIAEIQAPVLIVHGGRDRVIPFSHGEALYAAAVAPKESLWIPEAGHNDLDAHGASAKIQAFLESLTETDSPKQ